MSKVMTWFTLTLRLNSVNCEGVSLYKWREEKA